MEHDRDSDNSCNSFARYSHQRIGTEGLENKMTCETKVCLFGFYSISIFVGYLMPNPVYINKNKTIQSCYGLI